VGLKAVCEEGIAVAIADEQNAFRRQRSLGLSDGLDLTLTFIVGFNLKTAVEAGKLTQPFEL